MKKDGLQDTDVICIPGAKIDDVRDRLEAMPSGYDTIALLVGGNDRDVTPPPPAATIVTKYGGLLDMAQVKAHAVTVSSICPRKTTDDTRLTIEAVNAGSCRCARRRRQRSPTTRRHSHSVTAASTTAT